jgi:hypothetical protein
MNIAVAGFETVLLIYLPKGIPQALRQRPPNAAPSKRCPRTSGNRPQCLSECVQRIKACYSCVKIESIARTCGVQRPNRRRIQW